MSSRLPSKAHTLDSLSMKTNQPACAVHGLAVPKPVVVHPELVHPSPCAEWERDSSSEASETEIRQVPSDDVFVPKVVMSIGRNGSGAASGWAAVWGGTGERDWHPTSTVATMMRIGMMLRMVERPNDTIQPAAAIRLAIRTDPIRRSVAIDGYDLYCWICERSTPTILSPS